MNAGFLLIDKPAGRTSHDVVGAVRRALGIKRVGHTGTLDPFATGLLPILIGRGTRLARFLSGMDKTYTGVIRLGEETDSGDSEGVVLSASDGWNELKDSDIVGAMKDLTGTIMQKPPSLSAKKIDGVSAHRRVRRGEVVNLAEVEVNVGHFELESRTGQSANFVTSVSSGTYVRALARDLGAALKCGAHLTSLRRTSVGPFSLANAIALEEISVDAVQPVESAIPHLSSIDVTGESVRDLIHGRSIAVDDDAENPVAMFGPDGFIGIGELEAGLLRPRVVLAE